MASITDTYKLIATAMHWDGSDAAMEELTKDIAIASNDANEHVAVRIAASLILIDSRPRPMQRAKCEAALAITIPDVQEASLHIGKGDTDLKKFEAKAKDAVGLGIRMLGVDELRQQLNKSRKYLKDSSGANKRSLPQEPGRPRPVLRDGVVRPSRPLASFFSVYATAHGQLDVSEDEKIFTMYDGSTPFTIKTDRGEQPLAFNRDEVKKIHFADTSPIVIITAGDSYVSHGRFWIEFASRELKNKFCGRSWNQTVEHKDKEFEMFIADACKEIKVRKAELELASLCAT